MKQTANKTRFDLIAQSYESALIKYPNARTDTNWLFDNLDIKDHYFFHINKTEYFKKLFP